ncbi:hypothetical protein V8F33_012357 [Rhypophila sp. PSN 637]
MIKCFLCFTRQSRSPPTSYCIPESERNWFRFYRMAVAAERTWCNEDTPEPPSCTSDDGPPGHLEQLGKATTGNPLGGSQYVRTFKGRWEGTLSHTFFGEGAGSFFVAVRDTDKDDNIRLGGEIPVSTFSALRVEAKSTGAVQLDRKDASYKELRKPLYLSGGFLDEALASLSKPEPHDASHALFLLSLALFAIRSTSSDISGGLPSLSHDSVPATRFGLEVYET